MLERWCVADIVVSVTNSTEFIKKGKHDQETGYGLPDLGFFYGCGHGTSSALSALSGVSGM